MEIIPTCFELHVSYDWRATASKLSPRHFAFSFRHFFGFSDNCGHDTYSQATHGVEHGVLNVCVTAVTSLLGTNGV